MCSSLEDNGNFSFRVGAHCTARLRKTGDAKIRVPIGASSGAAADGNHCQCRQESVGRSVRMLVPRVEFNASMYLTNRKHDN